MDTAPSRDIQPASNPDMEETLPYEEGAVGMGATQPRTVQPAVNTDMDETLPYGEDPGVDVEEDHSRRGAEPEGAEEPVATQVGSGEPAQASRKKAHIVRHTRSGRAVKPPLRFRLDK